MKIAKGFTLIEIAMVLIVIGVLLSSLVGSVTTQVENYRRTETIDKLNLIKQAILDYSYQTTAYLPCPDCIQAAGCLGVGNTPRDGVEDRNGNVCSIGATVGNVPWETLGIADGVAGDGWSTRYRYWVDPNYAVDTGFALNTAAGTGSIVERTADGTATQPVANNVVAVIFSHGKNTLGGISIEEDSDREVIPAAGHDDELNNTDVTSEFVSRPPTYEDDTTDVGEFDDIVVWISEYELKADLVDVGILP